MGTYKPAEHEETTSVAPLLQFFELVHIGDTIQSMVQVYFDKEMVSTRPVELAKLTLQDTLCRSHGFLEQRNAREEALREYPR
jgi:hypothetical protein